MRTWFNNPTFTIKYNLSAFKLDIFKADITEDHGRKPFNVQHMLSVIASKSYINMTVLSIHNPQIKIWTFDSKTGPFPDYFLQKCPNPDSSPEIRT